MGKSTNPRVITRGMVRDAQEITLHASVAETVNNTSAPFDVSDSAEGLLVIDITAFAGTTPTLDLFLETQDFLSGKWVTVPSVAVARQSGVATLVFSVTNFGENIRLRWVIGGTAVPSFTFTASFTGKS